MMVNIFINRVRRKDTVKYFQWVTSTSERANIYCPYRHTVNKGLRMVNIVIGVRRKDPVKYFQWSLC